MKKVLFGLLLFCGLSAFGQQVSGNLTASTTDCSVAASCVRAKLPTSSGAASITLSGTFSATLQFEASGSNDANYAAISCITTNGSSNVTSATAAGTWTCNVAGLTDIRVRTSAFVSGTVAVTITTSPAAASSRFGGGSTSLPAVPLIQYAMIDCTANVTCPDTSGNANTGTLTSGAVTAKGLNFAGAGVSIAIPTATWSTIKTIMVWYKSVPVGYASVAGGQTILDNGSNTQWMLQNNDGSIGFYGGLGQANTKPMIPQFGDSFWAITLGAPNHIYTGPNAFEVPAYSSQLSTALSGTPAHANIGTFFGVPTTFDFLGVMYYFMAFTQTLTPAQIVQANNFVTPILQARGISIRTDPYPARIYDGDSQTSCAVNLANPCYTEAATINAPEVNGGIVGSTIAGLITFGAAKIDPVITARNTIVHIFAGTNDFATNSATTAATAYANLKTYCAARQAAGAFCIPMTALPRNAGFSGGATNGNFDSRRLTYNSSINSDTASFDGLADAGSDPLIGQNAEASDTTLYSDAIHPSILTNAVLATYVINATAATYHLGPSCTLYTVSNASSKWTFKIGGQTIPGAAIAAATTQSVPFFWIQPRSKVASITIKTTTAWSGTGFTSIKATLGGGTGGTTFYTSLGYELTTAVSDTNFIDSGPLFKSGSSSVGENLTLNFTANQNLNANTITGSADITVCMVTNK